MEHAGAKGRLTDERAAAGSVINVVEISVHVFEAEANRFEKPHPELVDAGAFAIDWRARLPSERTAKDQLCSNRDEERQVPFDLTQVQVEFETRGVDIPGRADHFAIIDGEMMCEWLPIVIV